MSFHPVAAAPTRARVHGIGCCYGKHGFMISCGAVGAQEVGLTIGERYGLQLGQGDDAGRARIVLADHQGGRMLSRMGGGGARIQFGRIPALGISGIRPCERVLWKRIDKDTLEITLPDWAPSFSVPKSLEVTFERPAHAQAEKAQSKPPAPSMVAKPKPAASSKAQFVKGLTIEFKFEEESITFRDKVMDVTATEAALALRLANGAPSAVARSFLLRHVYPALRIDDGNVMLDRDARSLAKALEAIGLKLNTVKGIGFSIGGLV